MITVPREGRLWLLAAAVLFAAGWVKGINLVLLLSHLLLVVWILNSILAYRQLRKLNAVRSASEPVFAGQEAVWNVIVSNPRGSAAIGITVTDESAEHRLRHFIDRIEPMSEARITMRTQFRRRGDLQLQSLQLTCLYPFGLSGQRRRLGPQDKWVILPRLGRLNGARFRQWLFTVYRGDGRHQRFARPSMTHQDDLHGLRPFRPGDSPRWIHWRTSARRNQRMVREFEETSGHSLLLILDPHCALLAPGSDHPLFEETVSLAATIVAEWCTERRDQLALVVAGSPPEILSGYGCRPTMLRMLRALAVTKAVRASYADEVVRCLQERGFPEGPMLIVGVDTESPLAAALKRTARRSVRVLSPVAARDFFEIRQDTAEPGETPARDADALELSRKG